MNSSFTSRVPPQKDLGQVIASHPFLAGLKPEHRLLLTSNAMWVRYEPGEFIFRQGDPANRFYLTEEGRVSIESARDEDEPVAVQVIGRGDVLGWSWLVPPYYWQFDARAIEPTTAIFFYGTRLREQSEQDHEFGFEMMKRMVQVVVQRLQATRHQLLSASH